MRRGEITAGNNPGDVLDEVLWLLGKQTHIFHDQRKMHEQLHSLGEKKNHPATPTLRGLLDPSLHRLYSVCGVTRKASCYR